MKALCLLVCDNVQARLYRTTCPPGELTLTYQQVNFGGHVADFAMSLCKRLGADHRSQKFDGLAVMATDEIFSALDLQMDAGCRACLLGKVVLEAGPHSNHELVARLMYMLPAGSFGREDTGCDATL